MDSAFITDLRELISHSLMPLSDYTSMDSLVRAIWWLRMQYNYTEYHQKDFQTIYILSHFHSIPTKSKIKLHKNVGRLDERIFERF